MTPKKKRTCERCLREKDDIEFYISSRGHLYRRCKACCVQKMREYRLKNRKHTRDIEIRSYLKNREKILKKSKAYRDSHPEEVKAKAMLYRDRKNALRRIRRANGKRH